tara:strand:- start:1988 stop:2311 length:324 start_codon:yes stop_codon:yes gene_type:complete
MEKNLKSIISRLIDEVKDEIEKEDEEIEEATTTNDVEGYDSPFAFGDSGVKSKKKKKKISTNSTGYKVVNEELSTSDVKDIKKLIRFVVADILRDIWIKRNVWRNPR